ncbi:MAG TPA: FAD-dependent oxidoreductase [Nitrososphaeraceae archaeon]|nr:FAD-dependent oxidoreductase [Nitrososphaeraceae archaeon]
MRPVLLTVDDDPNVLRAIERDLRHQYGSHFRVLKADSGQRALELVKQLKLRNETLALLLVDQRMPQMSGVAFLEQAMNIFPDAKRVLLTAYADTEAAIRSINKAKIDYYLMKPWDPPQEILYPILDDLLDDWWASFKHPFEGIRVIGLRWSPKSYEVKYFLARNGIPYQWLDLETDEEARRLVSYVESSSKNEHSNFTNATTTTTTTTSSSSLSVLDHDKTENNNNNNNNALSSIRSASSSSYSSSVNSSSLRLPLVIFPDGSHMEEPTSSEIAEKIGLKTRAQMPFYDLIIIGGGPAGLAAAVYGASEGLSTLLIERQAPGGQAGMSSNIENYLGFPSGLTGSNLARRAVAQAIRFGAEILTPQEVVGIRVDGPYRIVKVKDGTEISCHVLIIACGVSYRNLDGVKGIEKLTGAGVYYGASMVDALYCKGEDVFMVGGANSAGQAAIHFSKYAKTVTLLVRGDSLNKSMSRYLMHQINETPNIHVLLNSKVTEVHGENRLESITITNTQTGQIQTVPTSGLYIFIGAVPHTDAVAGLIERDANGFILTGLDLMQNGHKRPRGWMLDRQPFLLETNVPGIFAAGDVRHGSTKRVAAGVGEGSIAVQLVHQYLRGV